MNFRALVIRQTAEDRRDVLSLYRPGPNQWSDLVQFLGGCSRGRPKTTREKKIGNFLLLGAKPRFGHKCLARKSHDCPARRTCILKSANLYASRNLTEQKIFPTVTYGCTLWIFLSRQAFESLAPKVV